MSTGQADDISVTENLDDFQVGPHPGFSKCSHYTRLQAVNKTRQNTVIWSCSQFVCHATDQCTQWRSDSRRGPQTCRLDPTVKHISQQSTGHLCEMLRFWSFLQSKSVNNLCTLLQREWPLLGLGPWNQLGDPWTKVFRMKILGGACHWTHVLTARRVITSTVDTRTRQSPNRRRDENSDILV